MRSGDTLQSIARSLWGDASLWYLIADANGLSGSDALVAGQRLTLPNKVSNVHNNASTFRPYNAGEAIGDISPTLPAPPPVPSQQTSSGGGGGGCGGIGALIGNAAVRNIVGQGIHIATGQQQGVDGHPELTHLTG